MGPSKKSTTTQQLAVYGELPGMKKAAEQYLQAIQEMQRTGGAWYPEATQQVGQLAQLTQPAYATLFGMLQPGWAEQVPAYISESEALAKDWANQQMRQAEQALTMRYGGAVPGLSTPYLRALGLAAQQVAQALQQQALQARGGEYQRRAAAQEALAGQLPLQTLGAMQGMNEWQRQLYQALLAYAQAARGQAVPLETRVEKSGGLDLSGLAQLATSGYLWAHGYPPAAGAGG